MANLPGDMKPVSGNKTPAPGEKKPARVAQPLAAQPTTASQPTSQAAAKPASAPPPRPVATNKPAAGAVKSAVVAAAPSTAARPVGAATAATVTPAATSGGVRPALPKAPPGLRPVAAQPGQAGPAGRPVAAVRSVAATQQAAAASGETAEQTDEQKRATLQEVLHATIATSPAWLTSMVVHICILLLLGLWFLPEVRKEIQNLVATSLEDTEEEEIEEIPFEETVKDIEVETTETDFSQPVETDNVTDHVEISQFDEEPAPSVSAPSRCRRPIRRAKSARSAAMVSMAAARLPARRWWPRAEVAPRANRPWHWLWPGWLSIRTPTAVGAGTTRRALARVAARSREISRGAKRGISPPRAWR